MDPAEDPADECMDSTISFSVEPTTSSSFPVPTPEVSTTSAPAAKPTPIAAVAAAPAVAIRTAPATVIPTGIHAPAVVAKDPALQIMRAAAAAAEIQTVVQHTNDLRLRWTAIQDRIVAVQPDIGSCMGRERQLGILGKNMNVDSATMLIKWRSEENALLFFDWVALCGYLSIQLSDRSADLWRAKPIYFLCSQLWERLSTQAKILCQQTFGMPYKDLRNNFVGQLIVIRAASKCCYKSDEGYLPKLLGQFSTYADLTISAPGNKSIVLRATLAIFRFAHFTMDVLKDFKVDIAKVVLEHCGIIKGLPSNSSVSRKRTWPSCLAHVCFHVLQPVFCPTDIF
ncbi:hypothetical protein DFJ77DRAFT_507111 [Powellomyces hirtus]|nr:hypothetical protein DFJ77DRAFT_507111 [Powellomyces hirtus]